jgi:predicted O-methyltransferase YrrM
MIDNISVALNFSPPGHFYSPHPDLNEVESRAKELFGDAPAELPGIDLNIPGQLELLAAFAKFYADLPWSEDHRPPLRYCYGHGYFCHGDAIALFSILRHFQPKRIMEVGSGFSTAVMLDTLELFGHRPCEITCIEPYPDRLRSLLRGDENASFRLQEQRLQDVDAALFETLETGDVLFIDSSHVAKIGSDVNRLIFEVLPSLKSGVLVHFHDIFYPFEYPRDWIMEGRAWNEAYLLRAFLQFNTAYRIIFFNNYLHFAHREAISARLPLTIRNPGGSLWLQKV